jgi:(2Fe-2S) ferredoxin
MSVTFVIADCVMLYCPCASRKERKYYKRIKRLNAKNVLEQKLNRGESVDLKEFVIKT